MTLATGTTLGNYEVIGLLGAGGMGEVYRARDTKLKRDVAIKVPPEGFSRDTDRLSRFQREGQVLASLNHPNIAHIYGLEETSQARCIVMELVEGDTLADRLKRGPMAMNMALQTAKQIADALEAAHEKGIVHRDLKPANIKLTAEGKVKVLDFGLAKMFVDSSAEADLSQSPTLMSGTIGEVILGTAAYMSPEQARGKTIDKRTDIWAFGCVLFEILSGRQVFAGETISDTIARILERQPDWPALPSTCSPRILGLLRRCLQKDPTRRLHDIADARLEIEDALSGNESPATATVQVITSNRARVLWFAAGVLAAVLLLGGFFIMRTGRGASLGIDSAVRRFVIDVPGVAEIAGVALSPDGEHLVYAAGKDKRRLYHRSFDQFDSVAVPGTEGASDPFFSPDGKWVGFFANNRIMKVPLSGGVAVTVCEVRGFQTGANWSGDKIIFSPDIGSGLFQVSDAGGEPRPLTTPARDKGEIGHFGPYALPDGKAVLFTVVVQEGLQVAVLSLDTGQWHRLAAGTRPQFAATGHLVFTHSGTVFGVPLDRNRLQLAGTPAPLIEKVGNSVLFDEPVVDYGVSATGHFVFVPRSASTDRLVWVDRDGKITPLRAESYNNSAYPRFSPDGRQIALGGEDAQIWILDLERGTRSKLTHGGMNFVPAWSPDGKRIAFGSYVEGSVDILWGPADLSEKPIPLLTREYRQYPASWLPDGRSLVFQDVTPTTGLDIRILTPDGSKGSNVSEIIATAAEERSATLSPDGRWVAYASNETGRFEIYVRPVGRSGGAVTVSTSGGDDPIWSRDGHEIFYIDGRRIMSVTVRTDPALSLSVPRKLLEGRFRSHNIAGANYDVTPDGKRFLMIAPESEDKPMQINVVLNWLQDLNRLAPGAVH